MGYLSKDQGRLIEAYQRRNLLIHNAGYVNQIYRNKVPEDLQEKIPPDVPISMSKEYLEKAIGTFERSFILIAAELWKKQNPSDYSRGRVLIDIAFGHLVAER